jgi:hypothetical protein
VKLIINESGSFNKDICIRYPSWVEEGGIASSVNMATLVYKNWKQEGDQLILAGNSIGNGQTIEFIDTMKIKKITADSLVLDNRGMEIRYAKQK